MARVARLRRYPVKSLDGEAVESATIAPGGGLAGDREFALFGPDGEPITAKRTADVHPLRTSYDAETATLTVEPPGATTPGQVRPR
ncbi:MAG: MOSC N-terminal beta barrel domain-containing protein [Halobacteriales archaeon]|nr:MOSC N-terminal beta barrel domain-containing protein [Halobacteriales archaeon]